MSVNRETIESIRKNCLLSAQEFHPSDVDRLKTDDWTIERFILVNKCEDTALKAMVKAMKWRKSFGVNEFSDEYFPEEVYKIGQLIIFGKDKESRQLLWLRMGRHHKSSELGTLIKQFTVYCIEKVDRHTKNQGWAVINDTTGSGLSNIDLDYSNFFTEVLQSYYPRGHKYFAAVDMPFILSTTSKLVISFMNEELRNTMKFIKKEQLIEYLDPQYIPVHLNGNYANNLTEIQSGVKPLEQLSHTKFSSQQIRNIRSTFKRELN